ncbi:MAG TPA: gliding motility-associated C-terminal domain-containing protein [Bacteroidia bacterium]
MKTIQYILLILSPLLWRGVGGEVFAQTNVPPPHVLNSAGGSVKIVGGNYYGYNIGEPIVGTGVNPGNNYYTQGFLQPNYAIGNSFNASIYYGDESCEGANDGFIVANVYNNKGHIHYSLPPSADSSANSVNLAPGTYTLTIHDSINKPLIQVITIKPSTETCPVHAHNAFSPNGDGLNDTYIIDGIENYPNNHVYFFNRWGQQLWDKAHYDNITIVWNGKDSKGDALYAGTYFYVIDIDGKKPMKGWVEITK